MRSQGAWLQGCSLNNLTAELPPPPTHTLSDIYTDELSPPGRTEEWVGATDPDISGIWTWPDNSTLCYCRWDGGQPNDEDGTQTCLVMSSDGKQYHDRPGNQLHRSICSMKNGKKHFFLQQWSNPSLTPGVACITCHE